MAIVAPTVLHMKPHQQNVLEGKNFMFYRNILDIKVPHFTPPLDK